MTSDASKGVGIFVPAMSTFDNFANSYDDALAQGLNVTGESREYFARGRIDFLKGCLDELAFHPESAIDFGCGTGANLPLLQKIAVHVMGLDESEKSVAIAESYATTRRPSEFRPSGGVDLVFDAVGGDYTEAALRGLRPFGRLLVIGFAAGPIPRIPLNLVLVKGVQISGFQFQDLAPDEFARNEEELRDLLVSGRVAPHIGATFPLAETASALRHVADGKAIGKVLIDVDSRN